MPLNDTPAEQQRAANRALAEKLRLEPAMIVQLRSWFANISKDLEAFFARTGQVPDATVYQPELEGILSRQYRRVSNAFSADVTNFLREADEDDPTIAILTAFAVANGIELSELITDMENEATVRQQAFNTVNIAQDSKSIIATTQKDLDTSIVFGTLFLFDQGIMNPSRNQVAKASRKAFVNSSRSRPTTIATTVTQLAAEGTKQIEFDVFLENRNRGFAPPLRREELWITRGDQKVRASHVAADNTLKNDNGVFIVGGDQLKFPGDKSLGASAGNTINCRCAAVLSIDDSKTPLIEFIQ